MAAAPVNLNNGPPLPPGLQPAAPPPQPTLQGLAGQRPAPPSGSAALTNAIAEKLMMVEKIFDDIAKLSPESVPVLGPLVDRMRSGMGAIIAKGTQPAPSPMGGMLLPGGAPTS